MMIYREVKASDDKSTGMEINGKMYIPFEWLEPIEITEHDLTNILIGHYGSDRDKISRAMDASKAILSKLNE